MSLVEQAIARLKKRSQTASAPASGDSPSGARSIAVGLGTPAPEGLGGPPIAIDTEALRAAGYLPERSKDRHFAEHYRQIKRPLIERAMATESAAQQADRRLIMVTSALPGDGKTFTTINLALSIARERDVSVLLVDADALKQHVSDIFGLRERTGLLDALGDEEVAIESLIVATNIRGLSILPAGHATDGTAELFSSNLMRQRLSTLLALQPRRIVLLDSPPLLLTNEGRVLVRLAGQVALVVRAGTTPQQAVIDAIGMFDERQAGGIILNQGHAGIIEGYYGYGAYGIDANENKPK